VNLGSARLRTRLWLRTHPLIQLLAAQTAIGFGLAGSFVGAVIALDLGGIGHLLGARETASSAILLWLFTGLTFAGVRFAFALAALPDAGNSTMHGAHMRITTQCRDTVKVGA
jgi:hypothetical protein